MATEGQATAALTGIVQPSRATVLALPGLHVSAHPLVAHKLSLLRARGTDNVHVRQLAAELSFLLGYEATRDLALMPSQLETPLARMDGARLASSIALVPILRAGLGLVDGFLTLLPQAHVWHLGLYRDEVSLAPVAYYNKLNQSLASAVCLVLDPMLATGGSATGAVDTLKRFGAQSIRFVGLVAAPLGVARLAAAHPDVPVFVAALDDGLNDVGYIVPGLGDAGDRLFATGD